MRLLVGGAAFVVVALLFFFVCFFFAFFSIIFVVYVAVAVAVVVVVAVVGRRLTAGWLPLHSFCIYTYDFGCMYNFIWSIFHIIIYPTDIQKRIARARTYIVYYVYICTVCTYCLMLLVGWMLYAFYVELCCVHRAMWCVVESYKFLYTYRHIVPFVLHINIYSIEKAEYKHTQTVRYELNGRSEEKKLQSDVRNRKRQRQNGRKRMKHRDTND